MNNSIDKLNQLEPDIKVISNVVIASIKKIIKERIVNKNIEPNMLLQEDLGLSSLDMISLITELCDELKIDITLLSDLDLASMGTVDDITNILSSKKS